MEALQVPLHRPFPILVYSSRTCLFYNKIVSRVKVDASILDIGCCFEQDLRILGAEGLPTDNMFTSDIAPKFRELSYTLFNNRDAMKA